VPSQIDIVPTHPTEKWNRESTEGFSEWSLQLPLDETGIQAVVKQLETQIGQQPVWLSVSNIGGRVASDMQQKAIGSVLVSLIFIAAYIWFRFQKISYGLAAVAALVHDVLITLGAIAGSHWLASALGFLLIEDFKISLTIVAAILTVIGYSLNDTIVIFDRIREVRGKSTKLNEAIINLSVNQTLSRTLLTSGTTLSVIVLLYIFGGEGIHGFAFTLLVGITVGTYSSIFIASPILLWLAKRDEQANLRRAEV
jgi:SecD/SecF fusion protein